MLDFNKSGKLFVEGAEGGKRSNMSTDVRYRSLCPQILADFPLMFALHCSRASVLLHPLLHHSNIYSVGYAPSAWLVSRCFLAFAQARSRAFIVRGVSRKT